VSQHIEITRFFDAERSLVYRAFIDPNQLAQWFGPVGCWVPRHSIDIDARIGGHLRFVMTALDVRSPVDLTFSEIVENELLAGEMEAAGVPGVVGLVRVHLRIEFMTKVAARRGLSYARARSASASSAQTPTAGGRAHSASWDALL
jgi:uncharacterized protein YndB with AHSA1/START domain